MGARRMLVAGLPGTGNLASFAIVWTGGLAFLLASGAEYYFYVTLVCVAAQAVWLVQHLWTYYRDHPRIAPSGC